MDKYLLLIALFGYNTSNKFINLFNNMVRNEGISEKDASKDVKSNERKNLFDKLKKLSKDQFAILADVVSSMKGDRRSNAEIDYDIFGGREQDRLQKEREKMYKIAWEIYDRNNEDEDSPEHKSTYVLIDQFEKLSTMNTEDFENLKTDKPTEDYEGEFEEDKKRYNFPDYPSDPALKNLTQHEFKRLSNELLRIHMANNPID